jgi:hypothetical protein
MKELVVANFGPRRPGSRTTKQPVFNKTPKSH